MILPRNFHRAALAEAKDAFNWYEDREQGLGETFRTALFDVIEAIQVQPLASQVIYGIDIRRAIMHRFHFQSFIWCLKTRS